MNPVVSSWRSIKILEKIFLGLTLISIVLKHVFNYPESVDIVVFCIVLIVLYFPTGFYYIGKLSTKTNVMPSILFGLAYATGILVLILVTFKIDGYLFPLGIVALFLIIIVAWLLFKLKSNSFDKVYVYAQFIRISFIVLTNLIASIKPYFYLSELLQKLMDIATKYKIVEKIIQTNDDVLLGEIKSLIDSSEGDFWRGLSSELKQAINEAKNELDRGEGSLHSQVMAEIRNNFLKK
jgi:hypothetical protein